MSDPETTTPAPEEPDAELLRLGIWHEAMLRQHEETAAGPPTAETIMNAMLALENRIAAIPATTLAGMIVKLRVMWSWECAETGRMFIGPTPEASGHERLAWGLMEDAKRLAGQA